MSPGCNNCYAFALHDQRYKANSDAARAGEKYPQNGPHSPMLAREMGKPMPFPPQYDRPFSTVQMLDDERLTAPLRARKPRAYFVDSMADLFHEDVTDAYLDRVFCVMMQRPQHLFLILTKRPQRMRAYLGASGVGDRVAMAYVPDRSWNAMHLDADDREEWGRRERVRGRDLLPLSNVWLGVSVEDQERADERIPLLLDTPAAVRFLSCEPLLGPLEFSDVSRRSDAIEQLGRRALTGIDWIIAGGESGPRSRAMDLAWARSLRDQCAAAGVPFFMKQLGRWIGADGDDRAVRSWLMADGGISVPPVFGPNASKQPEGAVAYSLDPHGSNPVRWPADLRVRQWPQVVA